MNDKPVTRNQANILNIFFKPLEMTESAFHFTLEKPKNETESQKLMIKAKFNEKFRPRVFNEFYKIANDEVP